MPTNKSERATGRTRWLSDSEQAVWRGLLCVEARLNDRLDRELRAGHDLSMAEYAVLVHLSEGPRDGIRMSELAERLLLSRSGLTRRVDSMVKAGLVGRRTCPADGRGLMAQLTPAGRKVLEAAAPTHVAGVRRYLIEVLAGDLDALAGGLARIEAALDSDPCPCPAAGAGSEPGSDQPGSDQPGSSPATTGPPRSTQPFVPPATETAR